jgi:hypothetical protein
MCKNDERKKEQRGKTFFIYDLRFLELFNLKSAIFQFKKTINLYEFLQVSINFNLNTLTRFNP